MKEKRRPVRTFFVENSNRNKSWILAWLLHLSLSRDYMLLFWINLIQFGLLSLSTVRIRLTLLLTRLSEVDPARLGPIHYYMLQRYNANM